MINRCCWKRCRKRIAALAAKDARIREPEQLVVTLVAQVAALTRQVAELTEKLGQNSRNSHVPPSSNPPGSAGKAGGGKPRSKGERKRGGQRDIEPTANWYPKRRSTT